MIEYTFGTSNYFPYFFNRSEDNLFLFLKILVLIFFVFKIGGFKWNVLTTSKALFLSNKESVVREINSWIKL